MPAKSKSRKSSGGGGRLFLGVLLGIGIAAGGYFATQHFDRIRSFFVSSPEKQLAKQPTAKPTPAPVLEKRMAQAAKDAPFSPSEDVFESGAHLYMHQCANCHGTLRQPSATSYQSREPQFWLRKGVHTFDKKSTGDIHDAIANGTPEKGMPAYHGKLSETEIWQLSLLLKSNNIELPDPVRNILSAKP